jgi:hypothetical protein
LPEPDPKKLVTKKFTFFVASLDKLGFIEALGYIL